MSNFNLPIRKKSTHAIVFKLITFQKLEKMEKIVGWFVKNEKMI